MLARIRKAEENDKGFTLIELLVVVIIIGILAAIAIPTFLKQRENGWEAQAKSDLRNGVTNAESYATSNNGEYTGLDVAAVTEGIDANTTMAVGAGVTATNFCIQATHTSFDPDKTFSYNKADDAIVEGACAT